MNYYNKYLFLKGGNFGTNHPNDFSLDFYKNNIIVNDTLTINDDADLNEIKISHIYPDFLNKIKHVKILTNNFKIDDLDFFLNLPNITKLTIPSDSSHGPINITYSYKNLKELIITYINFNRYNITINPNSCINLKKIIFDKFNHNYDIIKIKEINKLEEIIFNKEYNCKIHLIDNPELKLIIVKNIDFNKLITLENLPKLEKINLPINFKGTIELKNMTNYINLLFSNHLKLNDN